MDNLLVQLILIIAGGAAILLVVRFSHKSYEGKYGKASNKDRLRFALIFLFTLTVMMVIIFYYPIAGAFLIASIILSGYLGILGTKPGLYKDFMYSATICSFITGFTGWLIHGM